MDTSIQNIWRCWRLFRRGKRKTEELARFEYFIEENLQTLEHDLSFYTYRHGPYDRFTVYENKKRSIVVAPIRDKVVHRMLYEYLVPIFDKIFIYDVWSCRKGKGVLGAIERAQDFAKCHAHKFVWRTDVRKFFDSVSQNVLMECIARKVSDTNALNLIRDVIGSYPERAEGRVEVGGGGRQCSSEYRNTHWQPDEPDFLKYLF